MVAPALVLGVGMGLLALQPTGARPLEALPEIPDPEADIDFDGLVQMIETQIGSAPSSADTDLDQFSDTTEFVLGTDPANANSVPAAANLGIRLAGRTANGVLTQTIGLYVANGQLATADLRIGASYGGLTFELPTTVAFGPGTTTKLLPGINPGDLVIVLELTIPEQFVEDYGYLGLYATLAGPSVPMVASVLNLFDFDGETVSMTAAPSGVQGGGGSVFKPLGGGSTLPSSWNSDQVCWQLTTPVGTSGSSIVIEVEDAGCESLDSYCNPTECAQAIGGTVTVLDVGALTGGG